MQTLAKLLLRSYTTSMSVESTDVSFSFQVSYLQLADQPLLFHSQDASRKWSSREVVQQALWTAKLVDVAMPSHSRRIKPVHYPLSKFRSEVIPFVFVACIVVVEHLV